MALRPDCIRAWTEVDGEALLFCEGESYRLPPDLARELAAGGAARLKQYTLSPAQTLALESLQQDGHLYPVGED